MSPRAGAVTLASPSISVLVVEDDDALRREFTAMIAATPGIALTAAAGSLSAARDALATHAYPDVLIVDLGLPDGDGTALIRELAADAPKTDVLVISVFGDEAHVVRAIEAGAKGYLLKDATIDEFVSAVRLVNAGGSPLSPMIARHVLNRITAAHTQFSPRPQARGSSVHVESLTAREIEILRSIAGGNSVAETATTLHLSPHTVTTHVKRIYGKLAVNNRIQAVNRARATGQLD